MAFSEPTPKKQQSHVFRHWTWEFCALTLAVLLLIAIVTVLAEYNGRRLPEWETGININTLVAVMSTLLRAALVVVLAEIIGQAKWIWFGTQSRPLEHFQAFDNASRGVSGSLSLLGLLRFGLRHSPLAVVAALTTALSLTIGPFTQQAIKTVTCPQLLTSSNASLPVANSLPGLDSFYEVAGGKYELGGGMKGAMINGLANPHGNDSVIHATCTTGNCTFPEPYNVSHSTMGLCSKCFDSTTLVHVETSKAGARYISNTTLDHLWVYSNFGDPWLSIGQANLSFADSRLPQYYKDVALQSIVNISALITSQAPCYTPEGCLNEAGQTLNFVATSCALYPCMKDLVAEVRDGNLNERVVSTQPALINGVPWGSDSVHIDDERVVIKDPCVVDNKLYTAGNFSLVPNITSVRTFRDMMIDGKNVSVPTDCYYRMTGPYVAAIKEFVGNTLMSGECIADDVQVNSIYCRDAWWLDDLFANGNATFHTLDTAFKNFATAVTNFLRTDGYGPLNDTNFYTAFSKQYSDHTAVTGHVHETTICMRLDWPWLLLPGLLCLLTIILLWSVLLLSHRNREQAVWKSSVLPLLALSLDPQTGTKVDGRVATLDEMQAASEQVNVRLQSGSFVNGDYVQVNSGVTKSETNYFVQHGHGGHKPTAFKKKGLFSRSTATLLNLTN